MNWKTNWIFLNLSDNELNGGCLKQWVSHSITPQKCFQEEHKLPLTLLLRRWKSQQNVTVWKNILAFIFHDHAWTVTGCGCESSRWSPDTKRTKVWFATKMILQLSSAASTCHEQFHPRSRHFPAYHNSSLSLSHKRFSLSQIGKKGRENFFSRTLSCLFAFRLFRHKIFHLIRKNKFSQLLKF